MANIQKDYNSMGLPMNINRSNPIPLDCSELWFSLEEAQDYARNNPVAYVGQSIKVINESTGNVACYIIGMDGTLLDQTQGDAQDTLHLYDTVTGSESVEINAAMPQCQLEIVLSSEVYTDLSHITVVLEGETENQSAVSGVYGIVTGLTSEPAFTLSLQSNMANFDPSNVVITCKYQLDLNKVLHDYVLHVDLDGEEDQDDINNTIIIDETLSISGAAADARAVGVAIANIDTMKVPITRTINGKALSENIVLTPEDIGVETETDATLTVNGVAADAKATGDAISNLNVAVATKIDVPESAKVGQVLSVKSIDEEGNIAWEAITPESVGGSVATDPTFSEEGSAADAKLTGDRLATIESQIADLLYTEIAITSFTNNIGTAEKGSSVSSVTLSWKTNKTPIALTLDGESIDASSTSVTANNLSISSDKTWTLKATDERNVTSEKTTKITFLNGVYYGAVNSGATIGSNAIRGLTKKLQSTKSITFTATANAGQYIVFALPAAYGTPAFNVGGFDGGFSLHSTFNFENSSGYITSYCVWISDNVGLGETTVKVS